MKPILILLTFLGSLGCIQAQINTDRPTQSFSPYLVPKGAFQAETGYDLQITNYFQGSTNPVEFQSRRVLYNGTLVRYGLGSQIEIRFVQEIQNTFIKQRGVSGNIGEAGAAASPTLIGAKVELMKAREGRNTQIAFLTHLGGGLLTRGSFGTQLDMALSVQHQLSEKLGLTYNLGGVGLASDTGSAFKYSMVFGYQIGKRINSFVELYGFAPSLNEFDLRTDFGLTYLINNRVQVDAYAGYGLHENSPVVQGPPDFITGFGVSFLLPKK